MEKWSFCDNNDNLIKLVIEGKKTATTCIYDSNDLPKINERSIILYDNKKPACIIETTNYRILKFGQIDSNLSNLEGEGSHIEWKENHKRIFKYYDPNFSDETLVVFEEFKLIEIL